MQTKEEQENSTQRGAGPNRDLNQDAKRFLDYIQYISVTI